jgi:hypothetical protein
MELNIIVYISVILVKTKNRDTGTERLSKHLDVNRGFEAIFYIGQIRFNV